jgi:hypothetical protein
VLVRSNVCWAHLMEGDPSTARTWIVPITRAGPTPNTAIAHLMLAAVELREGRTTAALERSRAAEAQIRVHDQNWVQCLPWTTEIELWSGHARRVATMLERVLARDLSAEPALTSAPLLVMLARAYGDALDGGGSPHARHSSSQALHGLVAGAHADPFGPDVKDVARGARTRLWEAELARVDDCATVEGWVRAAAEWDGLRRPHDSAYCRWRAAEVAADERQGTVASRLGRRATADARQHAPLRRAISEIVRRR